MVEWRVFGVLNGRKAKKRSGHLYGDKVGQLERYRYS